MGAGCCLGLAPSAAPAALLLLLLPLQPPPDAFASPSAEEEEEEEEAALLVLPCADEDGSLTEAAPSEGFAAEEEEPADCGGAGRVRGVLVADVSLSGMEASWLQSSW